MTSQLDPNSLGYTLLAFVLAALVLARPVSWIVIGILKVRDVLQRRREIAEFRRTIAPPQ